MSTTEALPRLTRLLSLVVMLQSKRRLTARAIADRFGISERTAYRDVRALVAAGIPIATLEGRGYELLPSFSLPPIGLSEAELGALVAAGKVIASGSDRSLASAYQQAMEKVLLSVSRRKREGAAYLETRMLAVADEDRTADQVTTALANLQGALQQQRMVDLHYYSYGEHRMTKRRINPLGLYQARGNWIVVGWCHLREAVRAFRLSRILSYEVLPQRFEAQKFDLQTYLREYFAQPTLPLTWGCQDAPASLQLNQPNTMESLELGAFTVVGLAVRTNHSSGAAATDIPALWQRFYAAGVGANIPNALRDTLYCVYTDYEGDFTQPYTCVLGFRVDELPADLAEGLVAAQIQSGRYLTKSIAGNPQQGIVVGVWTEIWKTELDRAYQADFEAYDMKTMTPEHAEVIVHVGLN